MCHSALWHCTASLLGLGVVMVQAVPRVPACSNLCQLCLCISLPCFAAGTFTHTWSVSCYSTVDHIFASTCCFQRAWTYYAGSVEMHIEAWATMAYMWQWSSPTGPGSAFCFAIFSAQWHPGLYSAGLNSAHISVPGFYQLTLGLRGADVSRHLCTKGFEDIYAMSWVFTVIRVGFPANPVYTWL